MFMTLIDLHFSVSFFIYRITRYIPSIKYIKLSKKENLRKLDKLILCTLGKHPKTMTLFQILLLKLKEKIQK
jgi:hypothetical protein